MEASPYTRFASFHKSEHRRDHRLGRLVRLRDPNANPSTSPWLDGFTTAVDVELSSICELQRRYYVCLGTFTSSDEAMAHFCELEAHGQIIPCVKGHINLEELERIGHVMYVDNLPHPMLAQQGWHEEGSRREMKLLCQMGMATSMHQQYVVDPQVVARRNTEEQERRHLHVVAAVVSGLRCSPFYSMLPNAPSRRYLDEMCLCALVPAHVDAIPGRNITADTDRMTVSMRDLAEASKNYEADVCMFLLELSFAKAWAERTYGSVKMAREMSHKKKKEESETGARVTKVSAVTWVQEATTLSGFDRCVRDKLRGFLLS